MGYKATIFGWVPYASPVALRVAVRMSWLLAPRTWMPLVREASSSVAERRLVTVVDNVIKTTINHLFGD